MIREINALIKENIDNDYHSKYLMECNLSDFKKLQRLMRDKYKIEDYKGLNQMWKHDGFDIGGRYGTVQFEYANFELNVLCKSDYKGDFKISKVNEVDKMFWNSK